MSTNTDRAPTRRPAPVSFADLARHAGVHRSTITRLFQGPLAAALLPGKVGDATHPIVVGWARARGLDPDVLLGNLGAIYARHNAQRRTPFGATTPSESQLVSDAGMSTQEFAERVEVTHQAVLRALSTELEPALLSNGRINTSSPAAFEFAAARPFRVRVREPRRAEEPLVGGADFLAAASRPDSTIDVDHPAFWVWLARMGVPLRK